MLKHKCIWCSSPCEITLAFSSEGCSNAKCRAALKSEIKVESIGEKMVTVKLTDGYVPGEWESGARTGRFSAKKPNFGNGGLSPIGHGEYLPGKRIEFGPDWKPTPRDTPEKRKLISDLVAACGHHMALTEWQMITLLGSRDLYSDIAAIIYCTPLKMVSPAQREAVNQCTFSTIYGSRSFPTGKLDTIGVDMAISAYAEADAMYVQRAHETEKKSRHEQIEANILRWPNTMRVVDGDRKRVDKAGRKNKAGMELVGILSLVEAPYSRKGLLATYDYISIENPTTGRCRFRVRRTEPHTSPKSFYNRVGQKYSVTLAYSDERDRAQFLGHHIDKVLNEFESIDDSKHHSRKPTEAEELFFSLRRSA